MIERQRILQRRRELRKAKKDKAKHFKAQKKLARHEKKAEIVARIRAKRVEAQSNGNSGEDGCWLCGETSHRKQNCPNRSAGDLNKTCFQCRRRGHTSQNCPQNGDTGVYGLLKQQTGVCFNCGDVGHVLRDCSKPAENGGATYATCFVCSQQGHLSSKCPQNMQGVYPKGGCCKLCKSIEHLARDCPNSKISLNSCDSEKMNKKIIFADEDGTNLDNGNTTGDALDSHELGWDDENNDGNFKQAVEHKSMKSNTTHPKRVIF